MNSKLWLIISGVVLASFSSSLAAPPNPVPIGDKTPSKVAEYAKSQVGKRIGNGRATDFIKAALAAAGADPGEPTNDFPVWGERRSSILLLPGQIIQFEQCWFKSPDGKTALRFAHHTAIVKNMVANKEGSKNRKVVLIHQGEEREYHKSAVHETELDLSWHKEGEWRNYSPIPAKARPSLPGGAPAVPSPVKPKPRPTLKPAASRLVICTPIDWVQVNLDAGLDWFGRDVPGIRESPETKDSLTAMLKKHGFETQYRGVKGAGGSVKLQLFARLTKETRTANTTVTERQDREMKAIADMIYGGPNAVGKKIYLSK